MEALVLGCPCLGDPASLGSALDVFLVVLGAGVALGSAGLWWAARRKIARLDRWAAKNLPPTGAPGGEG